MLPIHRAAPNPVTKEAGVQKIPGYLQHWKKTIPIQKSSFPIFVRVKLAVPLALAQDRAPDPDPAVAQVDHFRHALVFAQVIRPRCTKHAWKIVQKDAHEMKTRR